MFIRITIFVMMALGLVGFGVVAWLSIQQPGAEASTTAAAAEAAKETILVAAHDLAAGALLKADDIVVADIPSDKVAEGASLDTAAARHQLIGSMVRSPLGASDPFLPRDLLRPGDHGFLATVLGAGMRAVTIGVDAISGTAGLIWPGDHVDVLLTHQMDDKSRPAGHRIAAETVLTNVRVIAIDQQLMQGTAPGSLDAKPAATVTLEVTSPMAEAVSVATQLGGLSLVVRAAREGKADGPADNAPGITWASDVSPALLSTAQIASPSVVHVFRGNGDGQELPLSMSVHF